ncbi:ATP-binding protein [Streptomyces sp. NPDC085481]|uniref:ATP-binding protein n=1 Tax=Streptomyces sp. NPDC085481 TaxID=3365727 RepID=UPI0037D9047F
MLTTTAAHPALPVPAPARAHTPARAFAHWVAEPTTETVPLVRSRVRAVLEGWRIATDTTDTLLLAVSELVGNVVRHAAAATGRMRVGISCDGGWLRLEVADGADGLPRVPDPSVEVDPDAEDGRGLLLVQLLATDAGGELAVAVREFGKCVQVRVPAA